MKPPRVLALCAGYGGLELAIAAVEGEVDLVAYAEYDDAPARIMAHHHPGVTNLRDVTKIDWRALPEVDVMTAGYPCQPFSHAGKRQGEDDPRHLWPHIAKGIGILRPRLCFFENVRGHLSLGLDQVLLDLDALGYDVRVYLLRAADVGAAHGRARIFIFAEDRAQRGPVALPLGSPVAVARDGQWFEPEAHLFGAAPFEGKLPGCSRLVDGHLYAEPAWTSRTDEDALFPTPTTWDGKNNAGPSTFGRNTVPLNAVVTMLPTPTTTQRGPGANLDTRDGAGPNLHNAVAALLPTPAVNDMGEGKTVEAWDAWTDRMKAEHGNGNGHGKSLAIEAQRLLPTPRTVNGKSARAMTASTENGRRTGGGQSSPPGLEEAAQLLAGQIPEHMPAAADLPEATRRLLPTPRTSDTNGAGAHGTGGPDLRTVVGSLLPQWGDYAPAIARWETVIGRTAPAPTEPGAKGGHRLSPRFVEWLMGLPEGHVCDVPDITRNQALKALGNGVVWQQAAAAYRAYLADTSKEKAA